MSLLREYRTKARLILHTRNSWSHVYPVSACAWVSRPVLPTAAAATWQDNLAAWLMSSGQMRWDTVRQCR